MFDLFIDAVKAIYPISKKVEAEIRASLEMHTFPPGHKFIRREKVNDKLYFIGRGLVRCYYYKTEGKSKTEVTSWIINEFNFVYIPHSFIRQVPSVETVEVLEEVELASISYANLQKLYKKYPETNFIGRLLTENYLIMYDERVRSLRMMSAKDRHDLFYHNFPEIYHRAPLKYIASFLGLTPETLSRVRANSILEA